MKGKLQKKDVVAYNLDVVISVGYRVKSIQGTEELCPIFHDSSVRFP